MDLAFNLHTIFSFIFIYLLISILFRKIAIISWLPGISHYSKGKRAVFLSLGLLIMAYIYGRILFEQNEIIFSLDTLLKSLIISLPLAIILFYIDHKFTNKDSYLK